MKRPEVKQLNVKKFNTLNVEAKLAYLEYYGFELTGIVSHARLVKLSEPTANEGESNGQ